MNFESKHCLKHPKLNKGLSMLRCSFPASSGIELLQGCYGYLKGDVDNGRMVSPTCCVGLRVYTHKQYGLASVRESIFGIVRMGLN